MDHNTDIKPIAKSEEHYQKWVDIYPFYANKRWGDIICSLMKSGRKKIWCYIELKQRKKT